MRNSGDATRWSSPDCRQERWCTTRWSLVMLKATGPASPEPERGQPRNARLKARFQPGTGLPTRFQRIAADRKSVFITVKELTVPEKGTMFP